MDTFFFIPHTHWEGAVFKTREAYLVMGLPNILRALTLLEKYPDYRFVLDQVCYVKPFLERYPEEGAAFRRFVAEGRLALVGGTDVMHDDNMPGNESYVRQMLYGKSWFRRALGVEITTSWQLDTFGHHAQMPQLLKLAGYESFWFFRGVATFDGSVPAEFFWQGLDGSRIPAFWLPHAYANVYGSPQTTPEFAEFMKKRFDALAPFEWGPFRIGTAGADVCEPEPHVPEQVEAFNRNPDAPFQLRLAVPAEVEAMAALGPERPVVTGEMNPIFQGTYSSRIELKQRTRELEGLLTTAEKAGVLLLCLGEQVDDEILERAWEPMLFNQAHDLMSGVMTDHVFDDSIRGYDFSRRIAQEETEARLRSLTNHIDTQGEGVAVTVFNSAGWSRTDVVFASLGFTRGDVRGLKLFGLGGESVPVQIVNAVRQPDGALLRAEIAFIAREVPALGHTVYRAVGTPTGEAEPSPATAPVSAAIENDYCRVEFDPTTGAIVRLIVKDRVLAESPRETGILPVAPQAGCLRYAEPHHSARTTDGSWSALSGPGNVVTLEEDRGDFWELYKTLDAASRIAMKVRHPAPQPGQAKFSTDQAGSPGTILCGPVFSEFTASHAFSDQGKFRTTVRLYAGLRRIEIRTQILNNDRSVRYRALFPTTLADGQRTDAIPFGAIARPDGIEFPAQHWIDWGNGQKGVALLNRGLPGNNVADGVMMLSLMRSTSITAYGFGGGYEPGMGSDSGFEVGKEQTFDYALVPHVGDWREAGIQREGEAFNQPLVALTAAPHPGTLPNRWGFLEIGAKNIQVSALKAGPDGNAILRLYETTGQAANGVKITFPAPVAGAEEVNLLEDPGQKIKLTRNAISLDFHPFEIKTVKLKFKEKVK